MWFVYILLCDQKNYYVGLTSNISNRLRSHKAKENIATKEFTDIKPIYTEKYQTRKEAEKREIQIKKWSKAKKKALVEGDIELLKKLSKS